MTLLSNGAAYVCYGQTPAVEGFLCPIDEDVIPAVGVHGDGLLVALTRWSPW